MTQLKVAYLAHPHVGQHGNSFLSDAVISLKMDTPRILVINPNSNKVMTDTLKPVLDSLNFHAVGINYDLFTAPDGPNSINNEEDAEESVKHCLPSIKETASKYAGFVVACFSAHPLTGILRHEYPDKSSVGIFETSVTMALSVCGSSRTDQGRHGTWGIVTTGKVWESLLTDATRVMLALPSGKQPDNISSGRFAGVQSTGLNASELHDADPADVRRRLEKATKALLATDKDGNELQAVVLGCAGMAELETVVRQVVPQNVKVVDGVKAAFCTVASMLLAKV